MVRGRERREIVMGPPYHTGILVHLGGVRTACVWGDVEVAGDKIGFKILQYKFSKSWGLEFPLVTLEPKC